MKNYKVVLTAISILTLFFISCSHSNEDLIIGKWRIKYSGHKTLAMKQDEINNPELAGHDTIQGIMEYEFFKDKTVKISFLLSDDSTITNLKYEFSKDGKSFNIPIKKVPTNGTKFEIVELTKSTLIVIHCGDTAYFSKVQQ